MRSLNIQLEQFEVFVGIVRQNVTAYSEIVQTFDVFKAADNCFWAMASSCCTRRAEVRAQCFIIMKSFVMNEQSKDFFSFFKEKYGYDQLIFLENGAPLVTI